MYCSRLTLYGPHSECTVLTSLIAFYIHHIRFRYVEGHHRVGKMPKLLSRIADVEFISAPRRLPVSIGHIPLLQERFQIQRRLIGRIDDLDISNGVKPRSISILAWLCRRSCTLIGCSPAFSDVSFISFSRADLVK